MLSYAQRPIFAIFLKVDIDVLFLLMLASITSAVLLWRWYRGGLCTPKSVLHLISWYISECSQHHYLLDNESPRINTYKLTCILRIRPLIPVPSTALHNDSISYHYRVVPSLMMSCVFSK